MKKLLQKILTGNMGKGRVYLSGLGYVMGVLIVLLSLNVYFQFQELLSKKKSANFLMVSKVVKNISFQGKPFSEEEILELKEQGFVQKLTPVYANQFGIWLDLDAIKLHTQAFAEAIPDEFIDCELPLSWRKHSRSWDPESDFVPIIISRDMINMYNFSFALSNGTPQITDNIIFSLSGNAILRGNGKKRKLKTAVVGLSERINSVLVPETFLKWANEEFGNNEPPRSHKLLVEVENRSDPKIQDFFQERDYAVEESKLINQKNLSILYVLLFVLVVFGIAFIIFSMTIVVSNFALLISEVKEEISLLRMLGYTQKKLFSFFFNYLVKFEVLATCLAMLLLSAAYFGVAIYLQGVGFEVGKGVFVIVWAIGASILFVAMTVSYFTLKKTLRTYSN